MRTLPNGSLLVSRLHPERCWPDWREALADVQDTVIAACLASRGVTDAPTVTRPRTLEATRRAAEASRKARKTIEETDWEEA